MNKKELDKIVADHKKWVMGNGGERADLQGAYLRGADLRGADLRGANLQGADLDFSCWPLWCGSKKVKVSIEFVYQLCAHIVVLECGSKVFPVIKKLLMPFAKKFKRWDELSNDN